MGLFSKGKPTPNDFATALISAIREAGYTDELRHDSDENTIVLFRDGEVAGQLNLANWFDGYLNAGKNERTELLKKYARVAVQLDRKLPDDYELAKADLRPRLWTRASLEFRKLWGVGGRPIDEGADLIEVQIGRHIVATLGYDWPETVQSVPNSQLESWDVPAEQAMQDAIVNLAEATEGYAAIGSNLYGFAEGDSYDASRIFLTGMIESMEVIGRHVALAPNRDTLMITGSDDEEGLRLMAEVAEESLSDGYQITGSPLVFEDDWWVDWPLPEDHPLERKFRELRLNWIGPLYEEQRTLLDERHQKSGEDVYVATFP